jgi:hypothetical protein
MSLQSSLQDMPGHLLALERAMHGATHSEEAWSAYSTIDTMTMSTHGNSRMNQGLAPTLRDIIQSALDIVGDDIFEEEYENQ